MEESCAVCRFSRTNPLDVNIRQCRKGPPQPTGSNNMAAWPRVPELGWCGQFEQPFNTQPIGNETRAPTAAETGDKPLAEMNMPELYAVANQLGLYDFEPKMTKAALIGLIQKVGQASTNIDHA